MPTTYEAIATVTVGSGGASSISFSSIPATYTDLVIKVSSRSAFSTFINDPILATFNGSTSNFSAIYLTTNGSSLFSGTFARDIGDSASSSATSNTFSSNDIYIPNYAGSTNKSYSVDHVLENNATSTNMGFVAGLWSNTAAITSITLTSNNGSNFLQYSTATLYGIKNS
jgi:hypothetical protein